MNLKWHLKPGEKRNALGTYTVFHGHGETTANQICETREIEHARLIATAPALLAACRAAEPIIRAMFEAEHMLDGFGPRQPRPADAILEQLQSAIAAAEGTVGSV